MAREAFKNEMRNSKNLLYFSLSFVLKEYGGKLKSLEEFHKEQKTCLESEYGEWLIDSSNLKQLPKEKKTDKKIVLDANANPIVSLDKLTLD